MPVWHRPNVSLLLGALAAFAIGARGQAGDDWGRRFLDEAPVQWARYRLWVRGLEGTIVERLIVEGKQGPVQERRIRCNKRCAIVHTKGLDGDPTDAIEGSNAAYDFSLRRNLFNGVWIVSGAFLRSAPSWARAPPVSAVSGSLEGRAALLHTGAVILPRLVNLPTFRFTSATAVERDGICLVRVEFETPANSARPGLGQTPCPIRRGTLELDPDRCWCLRSSTIQLDYGTGVATLHQDFQIASSWWGSPLPRRMSSEEVARFNDGTTRVLRRDMEFNLRRPWLESDDTEFTLTAYGFDEPEGAPPVGVSRNQLLGVILAGGALGIALGVRLVRRRKARRAGRLQIIAAKRVLGSFKPA